MFNNKLEILVVVSILVILASIGFSIKNNAPETEQEQYSWMIHEIKLKDSTRCAVLYRKEHRAGMGGISCDWK
jgi:hypothetical protein